MRLHIIYLAIFTLLGAFSLGEAVTAGDLSVSVTSHKGKALHNAVVMLTPKSGQKVTPTDSDAMMAQENRLFTPFILPVRIGEKVTFPNRDPIRHHVYSFSKTKRFELRLYSQDEENSIMFDKTGSVALGCNIHDNMLAFIYVTEAPLYTKSDEKGVATFKNLPAGDYAMQVWHVDMKKPKQLATVTITLAKSGNLDQSVTLNVRRSEQKQRKPGDHGGVY